MQKISVVPSRGQMGGPYTLDCYSKPSSLRSLGATGMFLYALLMSIFAIKVPGPSYLICYTVRSTDV